MVSISAQNELCVPQGAPIMNTFCKNAIRNTLIVAGLTAGFGMTTVYADDAAPQAHSDGVRATIADTAITAKVKSKLLGEDSLKQSDISVTTTNAVVTLDGTASSQDAKTWAETATKAVDGVKSVDNQLKAPGSSKAVAKTKQSVSDGWITTKVKSELLADSVAKGLDIKVETTRGVVVLTGVLATRDAIEHVKDVAAKVEGVKSVDTTGLFIAASNS
jgi:hyperosmotically inducible protein